MQCTVSRFSSSFHSWCAFGVLSHREPNWFYYWIRQLCQSNSRGSSPGSVPRVVDAANVAEDARARGARRLLVGGVHRVGVAHPHAHGSLLGSVPPLALRERKEGGPLRRRQSCHHTLHHLLRLVRTCVTVGESHRPGRKRALTKYALSRAQAASRDHAEALADEVADLVSACGICKEDGVRPAPLGAAG
eukprot:683229-Prymnesium_polylepis.1